MITTTFWLSLCWVVSSLRKSILTLSPWSNSIQNWSSSTSWSITNWMLSIRKFSWFRMSKPSTLLWGGFWKSQEKLKKPTVNNPTSHSPGLITTITIAYTRRRARRKIPTLSKCGATKEEKIRKRTKCRISFLWFTNHLRAWTMHWPSLYQKRFCFFILNVWLGLNVKNGSFINWSTIIRSTNVSLNRFWIWSRSMNWTVASGSFTKTWRTSIKPLSPTNLCTMREWRSTSENWCWSSIAMDGFWDRFSIKC